MWVNTTVGKIKA